jgi:hypothetical protein
MEHARFCKEKAGENGEVKRGENQLEDVISSPCHLILQ